MTWYRATLRSPSPKTITHFYGCSRCDAVSTIDSVEGAPQAAQAFASATDADTAVWLPSKRKTAE
jgi:hypothetical protein